MALLSGVRTIARTARRRKLSTVCSSVRTHPVLIFEGDGVSREIVNAARTVVDFAAEASVGKWRIQWREMDGFGCEASGIENSVEERHLRAFEETRVLLKGTVAIPNSGGYVEIRGKRFTSPNQVLRKLFDLYANVRPARSVRIGGVPGRFDDVAIDLLVVRENTEDLYQGSVPERWVDDDTVDATKRITRGASRRVAEYAFQLAKERQLNRRSGTAKVTAVHKASVLKQADGLFLDECRFVAETFAKAGILYEEASVDSVCADLVMRPGAYDVMVMPNTWGDIISDLVGGVVGSHQRRKGLIQRRKGLLGSSNVGKGCALFEPSHGPAPDIAGEGIANPTSMIFSAAMMLRHLGEFSAATTVENALLRVFADGCATPDVGGKATTDEVVQEICSRLRSVNKFEPEAVKKITVHHKPKSYRCSLSAPQLWPDDLG